MQKALRMCALLAVVVVCGRSSSAAPTIDRQAVSAAIAHGDSVPHVSQGVSDASNEPPPAPMPTPISIVMDGGNVVSNTSARSPGEVERPSQNAPVNVWSLPPRGSYFGGGGYGGYQTQQPYRGQVYRGYGYGQTFRAYDDSTTGPTPPPDTTPLLDLSPLATQAQTSLSTYIGQILPIIGAVIALVLGITVISLIVNALRKG